MQRRERGTAPKLANDAGRYLGFGLTWAASTGLFLFLGYLVDGWLGTLPLFLILGSFVGAGAGFYSLYHHLVVAPRRRSEDGDAGKGDEAGPE